jgi:hypothetical protein
MNSALINKRKIYKITLWLLLIISILGLVSLAPTLTNPKFLPSDDFFQFWAGGFQILHGSNPYDPAAIDQLRVQQGSVPASIIPISLNPPWTLTLSMPFGLLDFPASRLVWLLISITIVLASALILWQLYNGKLQQRWLAILAVFLFAPTLSVLEKGQLSVLVLLGLVGFLYFSSVKRNDWLAGACLYLVSIKPQLIVLFWFAVFIWVVQERRWRLLLSAVLTLLVVTAIPMITNPQYILQYLQMLHTYGISEWANPTIGAYLRFFWLGTDKFWVQFLPSVFALLWFLYYWSRHRRAWNWLVELPLILLVSLVTSPYAWTYDQVVLIPVVIQVAVWMGAHWKQWSTLLFALLFLLISSLDMYLHTRLDEFWFIWLAPAILIWYLMIYRRYNSSYKMPA